MDEAAGLPRHRQQARRRLPQSTIDQLVSDYLGGHPTPVLCQTYGLGKSTVLRLLAEAGVEMRRQGLTPEQVTEATALYEGGWSLARAANHFGVSTRHVHDRLRAAGVVMRDSHGRTRI